MICKGDPFGGYAWEWSLAKLGKPCVHTHGENERTKSGTTTFSDCVTLSQIKDPLLSSYLLDPIVLRLHLISLLLSFVRIERLIR